MVMMIWSRGHTEAPTRQHSRGQHEIQPAEMHRAGGILCWWLLGPRAQIVAVQPPQFPAVLVLTHNLYTVPKDSQA